MRRRVVRILAIGLIAAAPPLDPQDGTPGVPLGNAERTGFVPWELKPPYRLAWEYADRHKPRPAWREPAWEPQRIDFDYAYAVSAAGGNVYFASSADHALHALDLETGREKWAFFTGGPVRLAPEFHGGNVLFGSDDGRVYCLDGRTGRLVWRFRPSIPDERLIGNEQMISRWPARSGVLVEGGKAYTTFGMLSPEGVVVCCLDAATGSVVWQNDAEGIRYMARPHVVGMGGVSPQGYLALCGDVLVVTCGRAPPAFFDRRTGRLLWHEAEGDFTGGSWTMTAGGLAFSPCESLRKEYGSLLRRETDAPEAEPFESASLAALDARTGREVFYLQGGRRAVLAGDGGLTLAGAGGLLSVRIEDVRKAAGKESTILHTTGHFVSARDLKRWEAKTGTVYALRQAGGTLIAGGRDRVLCLDARSGKALWEGPVKGQARDLCLVPGALIASTTEGWIYCFRPGEGRPSGAEPAPAPGNPPAGDEAAARALSAGGVSEGYALAAGEVSAEFLSGLAGGSKLTVIAAAPEEKADALRKTLHAGGLYGTRVAVHGIPAGALPYADYFADLVVFDGRAPSAFDRVTAAELARVLRPGGGVGVILFPEALSEKARAWISSARLPGIESRDIPGGIRIRRGTLEGAGEWTHQYADPGKSCASADARVRLPLKALWFGGLGPAPVVSRHFRTPAPLVVDGRCFVPGTDRLVAMDIYNGRILWERDLPDLAHWPAAYRGPSLAADRGAVYALQKMSCLRLDPRTGETRGTYPAPPDAGDPEAIWDYLAVTDRLIVGAVGRPNIKHEWWSKAYPASRLLFALEKEGGKPRWTFRAEDAIDSDAIAIEGGRVFLIDGLARYPAAKGRKPRESRAPRRLVALDLETGRVAWKTGEVVPTQNSLWAAEGVVVATVHPYSRAMEDPVVAKAGGGVCAYDARDGKPLWKLERVDTCSPVLVGGVLYLPHAYDLRIGKPVEVPDPLGGGPVHFVPSFPRTCSSLSGSPNLLMSRSGSLGFYDLRQRSGTYHYPIVRASCWINMIPAGGLVVVPEGSSSCVCGYNYKTSLALMPADRHFHFGIGRRGRAAETTSLRINFGAPGDRPDAEGRLWYAWPRPTAFGRPLAKAEYGPKVGGIRLPVEEAPGRDTPGVFSRNPDWAGVSGTERPWLYSCGLEGPAKLVFRLPGGTKPRRVDLHFCDLEGKAARVFDVRLQDHVVLDDFCIQRESGRAGKAVDRTFSVPSGETLTLELIPAGGDVPPPLLSGISIGDPGEK